VFRGIIDLFCGEKSKPSSIVHFPRIVRATLTKMMAERLFFRSLMFISIVAFIKPVTMDTTTTALVRRIVAAGGFIVSFLGWFTKKKQYEEHLLSEEEERGRNQRPPADSGNTIVD
jgi:hypothetical protein